MRNILAKNGWLRDLVIGRRKLARHMPLLLWQRMRRAGERVKGTVRWEAACKMDGDTNRKLQCGDDYSFGPGETSLLAAMREYRI